MQRFDVHVPTRVLFGAGRIRDLGANLPAGATRAVVVTDRALASGTGAVDAVIAQLAGLDVTLFDQVEPNPSFETVELGATVARSTAADLVVGLGGGSPMDAAKGIALAAPAGASLREVLSRGDLRRPPLPVVCVPTTSGTGSEVTQYAVFTDHMGHAKEGFGDPSLFPALAVVDPELTYSMPRSLVVDSGLDVLTHAVEAYLSLDASPASDLVATAAIELCCEWLCQAAAGKREAMDRMAWAATLGGVAIAHAGTTLLHVMGYPLTTFHGVAHGRANAALLPVYLDFLDRRSTARERLDRLGSMLAAVGGARAFVEGLGVSTHLADYGVTSAEIATFVERVIVKDDLRITPAPVGREEIAEIYATALVS